MLKRSAVIGAVVLTALGGWNGSAQAQVGGGFRGQGGPHMGRSLEVALEHQEELGLSGDQVARLREMQGILESEVAPLAEEMQALREKIGAGELDRTEGLRAMGAVRGRLITAGAPLLGRVQEVFTVAQHRQLQALVRPIRPGLGGRGAFQRPGGGRFPQGQMRGGVGAMGFQPGQPGRGGAPGLRRVPRGAGMGMYRPGPARFWRGQGG